MHTWRGFSGFLVYNFECQDSLTLCVVQRARGYKKYNPFCEGQVIYDKWVMQVIIPLQEEKKS